MADHVVALVVMAQDYDPVAQPPLGFLNPLVNLGLAQVEIFVNRVGSAAVERRRGRRSGGEFRVVGCCGACCHLGSCGKSVCSPPFRRKGSDADTFRNVERFRLKAGLRTALFIVSGRRSLRHERLLYWFPVKLRLSVFRTRCAKCTRYTKFMQPAGGTARVAHAPPAVPMVNFNLFGAACNKEIGTFERLPF